MLLAVALVAGCGGGGSSGEADPATVVPPDALFYAEAVVRPEGSQREDALDAAGKLLLTDDPEGEIRRRLDQAFEDFDYERDVEPWLGERAGLWLPPAASDDDPGVLLLAATDTEQAMESLEAAFERPTARTHRDHEYIVDASGVAAGIVGDFVAIGREQNYRRTVDAAEGESLAETDEYADAVDALEDERLAHFWADTSALVERALEHEDAQVATLLPLDELPPVAGSFVADGDRLALEVRMRTVESFGPLLASGSTPLLQELPGDTWAAFGAHDAGTALRATFDRIAGAIGGLALRREFESETGLDLDRDLLDWIGHVAFFVRGTTPPGLDGGLVIQPSDEDKAETAFARIVGAIQVAAKVRARPIEVAGADQAFEFAAARSPYPVVLARGVGTCRAHGRPRGGGGGPRLGRSPRRDRPVHGGRGAGRDGAGAAGLDAEADRARQRARPRARVRGGAALPRDRHGGRGGHARRRRSGDRPLRRRARIALDCSAGRQVASRRPASSSNGRRP